MTRRDRCFENFCNWKLSYLDSAQLEREKYERRFPEYGSILDEVLTRSGHDTSTSREPPLEHSRLQTQYQNSD